MFGTRGLRVFRSESQNGPAGSLPLLSDFPVALALFLVIVGVLGGCSGSNPYQLEVGELAERFIPSVREVDAHPDSVQNLAIVETDDKVRFDLERDYQSLHQYWSSSFELTRVRPTIQQPMSYATLWSKEVSLAALQAEQGVTTLSKDQALERIKQQKQQYRQRLRIDVYWFTEPGETSISGSGTQVELRDDLGNTYHPARTDHGPLREAYVGAGKRVLYRWNVFYFKRVENGDDILEGVERLALRVRPPNAVSNVQFEWTWEDE